jgi:transcription initiation factor TFIIIB Brf1 subunit/transcription initiation factor TFIIB
MDVINFDQLIEQFKDNHVVPPTCNFNDSCIKCDTELSLSIGDGIIVCPNCHTEYGATIDDSAEWRNYGEDSRSSDPSRCGTSWHPLLIESSYGTTLGYTKNTYFNRLKQLNNWQSMPPHERSLKTVFDKLTLDGLSTGLTLNIIEFSHKLFAEAIKLQLTTGDNKLSRGDPRDGLIASCLFYSCKEYEVSRSPQEIAKICDINPSDVTRGINMFYELMKNSKLINLNKYITKFSDFIKRYCFVLGVNDKITSEIIEFAKNVDEKKILTKNTPQAMACGCIFFISIMYKLGITKAQISDRCGISIPTITKSYEKLLPYISDLI